jgi:heme/copper-type cytochrome/quinol oxidase subunit 2
MKKYIFAILLLLAAVQSSSAQCTMCKAAAESNEEANKALNTGIIYLLVMPYILIGGIGYMWWRNRQALAEQEEENELHRLLYAYKPDEK